MPRYFLFLAVVLFSQQNRRFQGVQKQPTTDRQHLLLKSVLFVLAGGVCCLALHPGIRGYLLSKKKLQSDSTNSTKPLKRNPLIQGLHEAFLQDKKEKRKRLPKTTKFLNKNLQALCDSPDIDINDLFLNDKSLNKETPEDQNLLAISISYGSTSLLKVLLRMEFKIDWHRTNRSGSLSDSGRKQTNNPPLLDFAESKKESSKENKEILKILSKQYNADLGG